MPARPPEPQGNVKQRSSFAGRSAKRLAALAVLLAAGLVAGFKVQRQTWAWNDPAGFKAYALECWTLAQTKAVDMAQAAKKKADESGLTAKTEELIERAKRALSTEPEAAVAPAEMREGEGGPEAAEAAAAPGPDGAHVAPKADPAKVAAARKLPPGYYEEFKAGYEAYREGLVHFRNSMPRAPDEQKNLAAAKVSFQKAQAYWEKAAAIYDGDPRLPALQQDLQLYLVDINKRIKPIY